MKKSTLFCDIDGTLFHYRKFTTYKSTKPDKIVGNINAIMGIARGTRLLIKMIRQQFNRIYSYYQPTKLSSSTRRCHLFHLI